MGSKRVKNKFIVIICAVLILSITCFGIISFITARNSFSNNLEKLWDGVSVASSFTAGNGTKENPYIISDGEEFIYFKRLIEEENSLYQDKYYALGNSINLNNHEITPIGNENNYFRGNFNGCGYTIKNVKITSGQSIYNEEYYGLFSIVEEASIYHLNIDNLIVSPLVSDKKYKIGSLVGDILDHSVIHNISIYNSLIDLGNVENNSNNMIGGFSSYIGFDVEFYNIYTNISINSNYNSSIGSIVHTLNSNPSYVIDNNHFSFKEKSSDFIHMGDIEVLVFHKEEDMYVSGSKKITGSELVLEMNDRLDYQYYWYLDSEILKIGITEKVEEIQRVTSFSFTPTQTILLHDSGVVGDTLYVNDLVSDYNHYKGLNYTTSSTGVLPTGSNLGLYTDSNLAKVYIQYNGSDISGNNIGYLSLDEKISKLNYYKYYVVNGGKVRIELIDHPFADRPNGKVFHGWVTDNPSVHIFYDSKLHVYYAEFEVTDLTEAICIIFYSSWIDGVITEVVNSNDWNSAFVDLLPKGFHVIGKVAAYESVSPYYVQGSVGGFSNYPSGSYDASGNRLSGRCWSFSGCTYYSHPTSSQYDPSVTYYKLDTGGMKEYTVLVDHYVDDPEAEPMPVGIEAVSYYKLVNISFGNSLAGYYQSNGEYITSGNCLNTTCPVFERVPYYDSEGNVNLTTATDVYAYYVNRDTNIVVLKSNCTDTFSTNKPFTLTGMDSDVLYNYYYDIRQSYISIDADFRVEYVTFMSNSRREGDSSPTGSTPGGGFFGNSSGNIYGNFHNLKIGRGVKSSNSNNVASAVIGGSNSSIGSASDIHPYRVIIESGIYNNISLVNGSNSSGTAYINCTGIYGSDYDRITANNSLLDVYNTASGSWGSNIYASSPTDTAITTYVKSGSFGSSKNDYTSGIYVGGLTGGTHYAVRSIVVEGGYIFNLLGGPLSADNRENLNDIYMNVKGGSIDFIVGGAGRSETYGNRIINVTGGKINYAIFGGSNGYTGNNNNSNRGTLTGSTFVYVGGNSIVGDEAAINNGNNYYGEEIGSVFAIGNGNSNYDMIGTAANSNVIIDGNAVINSNVYGGGNYGAVGINNSAETTTNIQVLGGTINGSVYGGGNNNGAGSTSVSSNINITVTGGNIKGSVYGGAKTNGVVYGNTNLNLLGGAIETDVYGGGEGGYVDANNSGTFVTKNVAVMIGSSTNPLELTINGSVYGGSAYGTVNGDTNSVDTVSSYNTSVVVNSGVIKKSLFGGGKGGSVGTVSFSPYVLGNVTVTVNGGNIGSLYGGNDLALSPNGIDTVYLNGGVIGDCFGGGNATGQKNTNIYLQGSSINNLFGGSNKTGEVVETNVVIHSGVVNGSVYGGNNIGGSVDSANILIDGITSIAGDIYGGGFQADTNRSSVIIGNVLIHDVYGGGEKASVGDTSIAITGTKGDQVFGGSNISGVVNTSTIVVNSGEFVNVFGGNNNGGTTKTTNITVEDGKIGNIYGGGNNASSTTSNVGIHGGVITNLFGGGNEAGLNTANVNIDGGSIDNIYGGSNNLGDIDTANVSVGKNGGTNNIQVTNLYGGNNKGGSVVNTIVDIDRGNISTVYGGGNQAPVDTSSVDIDNAIIGNVYGGGNEGVVSQDTVVYLTNATVSGSAYAGGNGSTAVVLGNTSITIDGNSVIGSLGADAVKASVFGSGNAAATGSAKNGNSMATVNIVGATIYGNVYGGANTSVVYGRTKTNIGTVSVNNPSLLESDIVIHGTVFGGGEANASGDENYDFSFISVTDAINIYIDGTGYVTNNHKFLMNGSIFGSGNASSSSGTSDILIKNLGMRDAPSKNISIQRANKVVLDNSVMELAGTTDRTNDYSTIKYSFNRIDALTIKNNTVLLLKQNANLLKEFNSMVDVDGKEEVAKVEILDDTKEVIRNVDNRIYLIPNRNLNITTNQAATAYGKVTGMTFFGMYNSYDNGSFQYGVYDDEVSYGDSADAGDVIVGGSYVLGLHLVDHDITVNGFYTNYLSDDYSSVTTAYIEPTPPSAGYYMWTIGIQAINYTVNLTASKYSSLGTNELSMIDFSSGDTTFDVIGFNSEGLKKGVSLIDSANVPKVTDDPNESSKLFGLSMKAETSGWTSYGTTKFLSEGTSKYTGDVTYKTDSQSLAPSMMFYLYHAKNISVNEDIGTVVISLQAATPINEIESKIQLIVITVNISAMNFNDGDFYDASITYDKKYEMPSSTSVNITNQSQFTAFYSLFAEVDSFEKMYGRNNDYYHALVTNRALPIGTQITMIDVSNLDGVPSYYYYNIDQSHYDKSLLQLQNDGEVSYRLSEFIKMGSTDSSNTYNDKEMNRVYYSDANKRVMEEFIFIFDLKETDTTGTHLNNSMLFELRNSEDRSLISVLGIRQNLMFYNTYDSTNVVLDLGVSPDDHYLYYDVSLPFSLNTLVSYDQTANSEVIIDTNYESSSMGLNLTILDNSGHAVSSSMLTGTSILLDGIKYFADSDGIFRIKLAGKVSNLNRRISMVTDKMLPPGIYTFRFTLFASGDGRHNAHTLEAESKDISITVVGSNNSIVVDSSDLGKLVYGETGLNEALLNYNEYEINYSSVLNDPNVRISVYKRDINNKDTSLYNEVPIASLFTNVFADPISRGYVGSSEYEKMLNISTGKTKLSFNFADNLTSGTYRVVFKLYDRNQLIDQDIKYVIVKKNIME